MLNDLSVEQVFYEREEDICTYSNLGSYVKSSFIPPLSYN